MIETPASVMRKSRHFGLLSVVLLALVGMALGVPVQAQQDEDADRFAAVFLSMASPEEPAKLAVQWTGDPSARLAVWVDFDSDGIWQESEKVVENAALKEGMVLLDVALPLGLELLPELMARFQVSGDGEEPREMVQVVGNSGFASSSASKLGMGVRSKGADGCMWASGFRVRGLSGSVRGSVVFDDGSGLALFVGGDFVSADDVVLSGVAKWDGTTWRAVGSRFNSAVEALAVYDDGSGSALFAGGSFTVAGGVPSNRIAKWNGTVWTPLESGLNDTVTTLAVYDDGSGLALYTGGDFTIAGGVNANRIARWDGTTWAALGAGMNATVFELVLYDDGSDLALYAGGDFTVAGGVNANRIAKWDGTTWAALGAGLNHTVIALTEYDDGSGPVLFVGGRFTTAGGVSANHIAKWDGTSWTALGAGLNERVFALTVYDDGSGPSLFAGGLFTVAGGVSSNRIAKWDGSAWTDLGTGPNASVRSLTVYDDGSGPSLFVGGQFTTTGGVSANHIAKWDGAAWTVLSSIAAGNGMGDRVWALVVYDDGSGPGLFAAGQFTTAGGVSANRVAKWDGSAWAALGAGVDGTVWALVVYDDGSGPGLFAAGQFATAGAVSANRIAKWDGTAWTALGSGLNSTVRALVVYDDGSGPGLFAAGQFTNAGGVSANRVAKWDGTTWAALGGGTNNTVRTLAVYNDGSGPVLYVAGSFTTAGGVSANRIAKWDGTAWTALGAGVNSTVWALEVHADGSGLRLFAAGEFTTAGGVSASRVAKWDGTVWTALGSGLNSTVFALKGFDDASGLVLYAGGDFTTAGGLTANRLAKWDGTAWTALETGVNSTIRAMKVYDDGSGPALYAGGNFQVAGGQPSLFVARYSCAPVTGLSLPSVTEIAAGTIATLPVTLSGTSVASTAFSIDYDETCLNPDSDTDGNLDNLISFVPPDFTLTTLFNPADADGEIDLSIADSSPPISTLPSGDLLSIDFQSTCTGPPTTPIDAPVRFSLDPSPTFGNADAQVLPGTWSDGIVRIWPGLRGDCNGSGALEAPDLTAVGLEIFDDDGEFWTGAPGSDFVGSPVGCDANASTSIRAADVVCTNLLIFGGACSAGDLQQDPPELRLSAQVEAAPDGELLWVRVEANQMQSIASLAFSLDLDPSQFDFSAVDVDSDGIPDHLRIPPGSPGFRLVRWTDDGELDVLLAELSGDEMAAGRLLEIGIPLGAPWSVQGLELSQAPAPSFGSTTGGDVEGTASIQLGLFADGFETGNVSRWSSVVGSRGD